MTKQLLAVGLVGSAVPLIGDPAGSVTVGVLSILAGLVAVVVRLTFSDRGLGFREAAKKDGEIDRLRMVETELRVEAAEQRHLKHELNNRLGAAEGVLFLIRHQLPHCSCGALDSLADLITITVRE